jgi:hypothetical protein
MPVMLGRFHRGWKFMKLDFGNAYNYHFIDGGEEYECIVYNGHRLFK